MRLASHEYKIQAEFSWDIQREGFHLRGNGTYLVTPTGDLQHETHYRGDGSVPSRFTEANDSQIVLAGNAAFVLSPPLGAKWVKFTPQEFGADWDAVRRLAAAHSPVAYSELVSAMEPTAVDAGQDTMDGVTYEHYKGTADANVLMKALADAYANQGQVMFVNHFTGPLAIDIWIDPSTSLPRRFRADGRVMFLGGDTHIVLSVDFTDFNAGASVTAPVAYETFADLTQSR